jgi:hypothetical protein
VIESYTVRPSTRDDFKIRVEFWQPEKLQVSGEPVMRAEFPSPSVERSALDVARSLQNDRIVCGRDSNLGYKEQLRSWVNYHKEGVHKL